ncbi:PEP-utilizing enzyme [Sphingobacterium sp. lm-10]|uniref:PEP/pyruvate-binding domain-containing protein n=1 Tax=Sphingobacterium sp. lm-10 TaxID=2944904 RepID=UPI002020DF89|nr:PEP/pyruvate-binding domain-containing protein [Sphingobacterium sp. lm-10]MCL7987909.1 PEP-utilizing enzyme [Sphingobacterium sp. lm-10]
MMKDEHTFILTHMIFIQDSQTQYITHPAIGEKAKGLFMLKQFDLDTPRWVVLPADFMAEAFKNLSSLSNTRDLLRAIDDYVFPASVEAELALFFSHDAHLAVRPSAWLEHGHEDAFVGQFDSFLAVPRAHVLQKIKAIWRSIFSEKVLSYRAAHRLGPSLGIAVIIQEVVEAQSSGIAFGLHPTRGSRKEKFVSAVFGIGGIVSADLEADTYSVTEGGIDRQIVRKREKLTVQKDGTITTDEVLRIHQHDQAVADEHLLTLSKALDNLREENQQFYQLEFAIRDEKLYILQAQPIWRLDKLPDTSGEYTIWDNVAYAEHFAGVTTPLAFSCIKTYTEADQKIRASFFGASKATLKRYKGIFSSAVGLINGRLYSNLRAHQTLEAMLPSSRVDVHFLPSKRRTAHDFGTAEIYPGSANEAWWNLVLLMGKMVSRYRSLSREGDEFRKYVEKVIRRYQNLDWQMKNPHELMQLYLQLERTLLTKWDIPFQVDFFFQVHFGWLQKQIMPFSIHSNPVVATDLLLDAKALATHYPLQRRIEIAQKIHASAFLKTLFETEGTKQIWHFIQHDNREETVGLRHTIEDYLAHTNTHNMVSKHSHFYVDHDSPDDLIATLKYYLHRHISDLDHARHVEAQVQAAAEEKANHHFRRSPIKRWWYNKTLRKTREMLRMKEDFQYDYIHVLGIVKQVFSVIGKRFSEEGILEFESDIFFLSKEEIFAFIEGSSITTDLNGLVAVRKEEYERFQSMPAPASPIATFGIPYKSNDFFAAAKEFVQHDKLCGVVSCQGKVQGTVRIWKGDEDFVMAEGEVIVAKSAHWRIEKELSGAGALLLEKGSVWSPLSVLARQLNVPSVVEIDGLLSYLKDGDLVDVDAISGEIKKIEK